MKKVCTAALVLSFLLLVNNQMVKAQDINSDAKGTVEASKPQDVGNKICPVTGEAIGGMGGKETYEYKGKIYNFCCPMCIPIFKSNPEKYIEIISKEKA